MLDTSDIEAVSSLVPDKFAVQILPIDNAHATAPVHETVVVADISHHLYARSHEYGGCVPVWYDARLICDVVVVSGE